MTSTTAYRSATAIALGTVLFLAWAMGAVGVIALALGKHQAEYSSVLAILGLTGMFTTLFGGSAWLFQRAAGGQARAEERGA